MENSGMKDSANAITPKQALAIEAIATSRTFIQAADKCGVSRQTLRMWLNEDQAFKAAYRQVKNAAFEDLSQGLLQLGERAVESWHAVIDAPAAPGAINLSRTANDIVSQLLKLRELTELGDRIDALESRMLEAVHHGD
jgi:hypothetical protein